MCATFTPGNEPGHTTGQVFSARTAVSWGGGVEEGAMRAVGAKLPRLHCVSEKLQNNNVICKRKTKVIDVGGKRKELERMQKFQGLWV